MARKISDEDLALAILTTHSQAEASQMLGCTVQTVCKRTKNTEFQALFQKYRKSVFDKISNQFVSNSQQAVDVLVNLLDSPNENTRYNSASRILSLAQDFVTTADILERLDRLEQH